jgi:hypothetical protein
LKSKRKKDKRSLTNWEIGKIKISERFKKRQDKTTDIEENTMESLILAQDER